MSLAAMKAKEFQSSLGSDFPSCYKMMVTSYITSGSSLGLPRDFCQSYLPKTLPEDLPNYVHFVLEDENGGQWGVRYFPYNFRISAGWKKFVLAHHLAEGDVLIFQLVDQTKFKVYIIKEINGNEVHSSLRLMNVEAQTNQMALETVASTSRPKRREHTESLFFTVVPKKPRTAVRYKECNCIGCKNPTIEDDYPIARENSCSLSAYSFQEVKTFKDFHIVVNGLCIDNEFADDIRSGYYRLCFQEKEFLHNSIPEHHSSMLVVGMIGETVNISLKIKNCAFTTTTKEELDRWDNFLKAFQLLGMKVGFLRDNIHALRTIMLNFTEAANELKRIEDEMTRVALEIEKLKEIARECQGNLCSLRQKAETYRNMFQELVDGPW